MKTFNGRFGDRNPGFSNGFIGINPKKLNGLMINPRLLIAISWRLHPELRNLVKNIPIHLQETPYAQVGVSAIKWECQKLGLTPPSDSTINRILREEGLIKKTPYIPKGVEYPYSREALGINNIHQADLLGR